MQAARIRSSRFSASRPTAATRRYLADTRHGLRLDDDGLWLSKLFDWFEDDFEVGGGTTLEFIRRHAPPAVAGPVDEDRVQRSTRRVAASPALLQQTARATLDQGLRGRLTSLLSQSRAAPPVRSALLQELGRFAQGAAGDLTQAAALRRETLARLKTLRGSGSPSLRLP